MSDSPSLPLHLRRLHSAFSKWLYLPSFDTLNVVAAAYLANRLEGSRLWLSLVGPASSGKTTLAESLLSLPRVHQLNSLTLGSFSSGYRDSRDPGRRFGMFEQLGDGNHLLVIPDFSSILRKDPRVRGEIFAQLRSIYDGSWKQTFGTGIEVDWKGSIGVVACTTPNFEREISSESAFGERFLYWRMPPIDPLHLSERALRNSEQSEEMRSDLRSAMKHLSKIRLAKDFRLPLPIRNALSKEVSFVALARTPVLRDPYTREISDLPCPESPARMAQQLGQLLKGLLSLFQSTTVSEDLMELVEVCAYSSIPEIRLRLLSFLSRRSATLDEVSRHCGLTRSVCFRALEDLLVLGLLTRERGTRKSSLWQPSETFIPLFNRVRQTMGRVGILNTRPAF